MMKKTISVVALIILLIGCACAEGVDMELWQHEAGWTSFQLVLSQDELNSVWEENVEAFGESMGIPGLTVAQMKSMLLQGMSMESGVDELSVEGSRMTGWNADGTEVFSHEYTLAETLEDKSILGGVKMYVFRTEEKDAGDYTYLLMTEPVKTEGENVGYTTFNLVCTGRKDYRNLFKGKSVIVPCTMIGKDTTMEGLAFAIERLFATPAVK